MTLFLGEIWFVWHFLCFCDRLMCVSCGRGPHTRSGGPNKPINGRNKSAPLPPLAWRRQIALQLACSFLWRFPKTLPRVLYGVLPRSSLTPRRLSPQTRLRFTDHCFPALCGIHTFKWFCLGCRLEIRWHASYQGAESGRVIIRRR